MRVRVMLSVVVATIAATPSAAGELQTYPTRYYVIHSDLPIPRVREAAVRLNTMAEEYHRRTRGFSGAVSRRLPFYLFAAPAAYHEAGGPKGSVGAYTGRRLMAVSDERVGDKVWSIVQHEGFHQFAHRVITPRLPVWVNEGLAEYFGEGIWTGDGYVTGVVPPPRLKRLRRWMDAGELMRFAEMLDMSHEEWNQALGRAAATRNYTQAWSMVHFLVHGDDGRYRRAFADFINDVAAGGEPRDAFERRFGGDVRAFERKYARWWRARSANPTRELYVKATVATLTSFLARAAAAGESYDDVDEFFEAAREGRLRISPSRGPGVWLPQSLLDQALADARKVEKWSLVKSGSRPAGLLLEREGAVFRGTFRPKADGQPEVEVTVSEKAPPSRASQRPPS